MVRTFPRQILFVFAGLALCLQACSYTPKTQYMNYGLTERQKLEQFADHYYDTQIVHQKGVAKKRLMQSYTFGDHMTIRVYKHKSSNYLNTNTENNYTEVRVIRTDNVKNKRKYMVLSYTNRNEKEDYDPFQFDRVARETVKIIAPGHKALNGKAPDARRLASSDAGFQSELYRKYMAQLDYGNRQGKLEREIFGKYDYNYRYQFFDVDGNELGRPPRDIKILHASTLLSNKPIADSADSCSIAIPADQNLFYHPESGFIGKSSSIIGLVYSSFCHLASQPWEWYVGFLFLLGAIILTILKGHIKSGNTAPLIFFIMLTLIMGGCIGFLRMEPWYTLHAGKTVFSVILILFLLLFIYTIVFIVQTTINEGVLPALVMLVAEGLAFTGSIIAGPIIARILTVTAVSVIAIVALAIGEARGGIGGGSEDHSAPEYDGGYKKGDTIFWNGRMRRHNGNWGDPWE